MAACVLDSIDSILASIDTWGIFNRSFFTRSLGATPTSALTTCGGVSIGRNATGFTMPSVDAALEGMYLTKCNLVGPAQGGEWLLGIEYLLGTLTVSTNVFSAGVSMPTKKVRGVSTQTASMFTVVTPTTGLTATAPTLTATYTDQDGNTGQTATMVFPNSPNTGSGFLMEPHLANGDTGVRAITNLSISTGSAGVLAVYGVLILQIVGQASGNRWATLQPLKNGLPNYLIEPGNVLNVYSVEPTSNGTRCFVDIAGVAQAL